MPTAVAPAVAAQITQAHGQHEISPKSTYPALAPSNANHSSPLSSERRSPVSSAPVATATVNEDLAQHRISPDGKRLSPNSSKIGHPPKIIVKKEPPSSPDAPASRHRPRKLDLSSSHSNSGNASGGVNARPAPMTAGATLGMQDVGIACLSPGFQTQDPGMREQLQRSISVRDQQRHIIESRLQKNAKTAADGNERSDHHNSSSLRTPMTSGKKRPPPGLSIVPPSHEQFATERVIMSAPLNQTFTGRHQAQPLTRHIANGPQSLSNSSHIHHIPVNQTQNRLPPITDVFAHENLGNHRDGQQASAAGPQRQAQYTSHATSIPAHPNQRAMPSPGLQGQPPSHPPQQPPTSRPRDYRSADEAVNDMAGGREDLLPKIVHYGGHQPPTPPSPSSLQHQAGHGLTPNKTALPPDANRSGSSRRRARAEYERDMGTPPLGSGPSPRTRTGPFGDGRDSPETNRRKKEEFLGLCARAWDLFHS